MHPSKERLIGVLVEAMKAVATTRSPWPGFGAQNLPRPTERDFVAAEGELKISFPEDYRVFITKAFDVLNSYDFGFLLPGIHAGNIVAVNQQYLDNDDVVTEQHVMFWCNCDAFYCFDASRRTSTDEYLIIEDSGVDVAKNFCKAAHDIVRGFVRSTAESLQEQLQRLSASQARLLEYDVVVRRERAGESP
jgi:hypothetical protein